jgi:hypothetical protein
MGIAFTYLLPITPIRPHEFENEVQNEDWGVLISSGPCHTCFEGVLVPRRFSDLFLHILRVTRRVVSSHEDGIHQSLFEF